MKKSVSQKGTKCFWQLYIVSAVHSLRFNENEADFLLCLGSTDGQYGIYKKLEVGDKFDIEEKRI